MSASVVGTVMLLARLLDGASDILMGFIIERTSSRWGKARPWILWMIIPLIITFLMAFNVPSSLGETAKVIYIGVTYILLSAVTYTACNMAYITLFTLFAPDSDDRSFAAVFRSLFAMLAALVINMISMPLLEGFGGASNQKAWTTLTIILAAVAFVCVMITFLGVTEKELSAAVEEKKNEKENTPLTEVLKKLLKSKYFYLAALFSIAYYMSNGIGGAGVYFAKDILGDANLVGMFSLVAIPTMVLGSVLAPILYKKFGKRKIMMLGSFIILGCSIMQLINPYNIGLFLIAASIKGVGTMLFGTAISTLPGDVSDWSEWKAGVRAEGVVTSVSSFGSKVGVGVGGALVGWILAIGSYDGSMAVQAQSALNAEIFLMIGIPLVLAVMQIVLLIFWDMDKVRPGMLKELEVKRNHIG